MDRPLTFSECHMLYELYGVFCKQNRVYECAEGMVAFLQIVDVLNAGKVRELINKPEVVKVGVEKEFTWKKV